jgi:REP element-mobilizing transposase RayT
MRFADRTYAEGAYFVTVCTLDKHPILGSIENGTPKLSAIGIIVEREWLRLESAYTGIALDEYVVMPNHIHGIIAIEATSGMTLPKVMREYKSRAVKTLQAEFNDRECRIWQRGYSEDVVNEAQHLANIRAYIRSNPANWEIDEYRYEEKSE